MFSLETCEDLFWSHPEYIQSIRVPLTGSPQMLQSTVAGLMVIYCNSKRLCLSTGRWKLKTRRLKLKETSRGRDFCEKKIWKKNTEKWEKITGPSKLPSSESLPGSFSNTGLVLVDHNPLLQNSDQGKVGIPWDPEADYMYRYDGMYRWMGNASLKW